MRQEKRPDRESDLIEFKIFHDGILIVSEKNNFFDFKNPQTTEIIQNFSQKKIPSFLRKFIKEKSKILFTDLRPLNYKGNIEYEYKSSNSLSNQSPVFKFNSKIQPPKILKNSKKCSLRVRLENGKNIDIEFNVNSKIIEIYDYVAKISSLKIENFDLLYDYPLKKLEKCEMSIEELGLENQLLNQKII